MKKVEISLCLWGISTFVVQMYKIFLRNANPLTLVNTTFILLFFFIFRVAISGVGKAIFYFFAQVFASTTPMSVTRTKMGVAMMLIYGK